MNLIQYLAAFNAIALFAKAGKVDVAQCNGRSALWINPSLCTDEISKCSDSQVLPAPKYEMYDVVRDQPKDQVDSTLENAQCDGRSALWLSPSFCVDSATELSKCSDSMILSASDDGMYDVRDEEQVHSLLMNFMMWASITRDIEMQKGQELCESSDDGMPWDIQMCEGDLKLVHRTQPMLGHNKYNFNPKNMDSIMSGKDDTRNIKSRFGLPSEKVREFMSLLKPKPMHWHKIHPELYI